MYQLVSSKCASALALAFVVLTTLGALHPVAALEIRVGHNAPTNDPRHQSLQDFAQRVALLSEGDMNVKVFPANTIGKDHERLELMQAGLLEMSLTGEILSNFDRRWSIISMPYLWEDQAHLRRFLNSEIAQQWKQDTARAYGLVLLGFLQRSPRVLTTKEAKVEKIQDLAGLKIRVPQIPVYVDTWRAFGVVPTPMPSSDFYAALEKGRIDGMENPLEVMSAWRIHEVSRHISLTDHMLTSLVLVASKTFVDSLTPEQQQILGQAAKETEALHAQRMQDLKEVLLRNLSARGMDIVEAPDTEALRQAALSVHQKYMSAFGRAAYDFVRQSASPEDP